MFISGFLPHNLVSSVSPGNLATIWQIPNNPRWKSAGLYLIVFKKVYSQINPSEIRIKSWEKGKNSHWEKKNEVQFCGQYERLSW